MPARFRTLIPMAGFLFAACGLLESPDSVRTVKNPAASESQGHGALDMNVELERTMTLAKAAEINLARLVVTLSAAGVDSLFDTLKVTGNGKASASKTYTGLASGKHWRLRVKSLDRKDSVVHSGTTVFEVLPRQTVKVSLPLHSRFTMLRAAFHPLKDSVNRCAIFVDDRLVADTTFKRASVSGDTVVLPFDYLHTEVWHKIRLAAYGRVWGVDTVLYSGDTTVKTQPGQEAAFKLTLNGTGYALAAHGAAAMEVSIGKAGRFSVQAELKDQAAHSGLVLHLPLDGHAKDVSDFANHGAIAGAMPAADRFGRKDGALAFDGVDDSILVPSAPSLVLKEALTLSLWVKVDTGKTHMLVNKYYTYYLYTSGSSHVAGLANGANNNPATPWSQLNKAWTHIVLSWDGLKARIYENGVMKSETATRGQLTEYSHLQDLVIGCGGNMNWRGAFLKGSLDDLRIFNRGLSAEEISALYKQESAQL